MGRRKKASRTRGHAATHRSKTGRVHLVVHRDESGNVRSLSLSRQAFREEWQNRLVLATASTVHGFFSQSKSRATLLVLCRKVLDAATEVGERALSGASESTACRSGCDHCCHQSVGASPLEVLTVALYLHETRSPEALEELRARVDDFTERTRTLSAPDRHDPALSCPMLEEGRCSVYPVRPLSCRGVNSLDAERCRVSLREPEARSAYLAGRLQIPRYAEPMRAAHAVSAGLQLGASELHGLWMEPVELSWGLSLALVDLEGTTRQFLDGGAPLAAARGGAVTEGSALDEHVGRLP